MSAPLVQLGEFMAEKVPSLNPAKFPDEEFELWSIPAFDKGEPERLLGSEIGSAKKIVQPLDVLLSRIVPHIRRSWVVSRGNGSRQIASGEWIIFRGEEFDPGYLRHFLVSDDFHDQFMQTVAGVGGSLLRARPDGVKSIEIPLPPLEEQRRIAAILDQADALRRLRHRTLTHLNTLAQSIFHEMFGDPAMNSKGWPIGTINDIAASTQYGTSSKAGSVGEYPILRMGNLTTEGSVVLKDLKYIDLGSNEIEKYTVHRGDILFNRTNSPELVGKTAVYKGERPVAYAGYLVRLRTNGHANPDYVSALLNSPYGKAILRGMCKSIIGMANINAKELRTIKLPLPPVDLQSKFSQHLQNIEEMAAPRSAAVSAAEKLFTSLQHRAFRGEL